MPRPTETEAFWRDEFTVTPELEVRLQDYFLEQNQPFTLPKLSRLLMEWVHGSQNSSTSSGIYNPVHSYEVGSSLTFPFLDDAVGEVISLRAGRNARYGDFAVMTVRFSDGNELEFASGLSHDNAAQLDAVEEPPLDLDELYEQFGALAQEEIDAAVESSENFVQFGEEWLPRFMLVDFHEGHLNIADAMIDIMGSPLTTEELLKEIPLEEETTQSLKRFSLNYALSQNESFVNQGSDDQPLWSLTRLTQ